MAALNAAEAHDFLVDGGRIAKLGTLREGWPYVSPVWYEWDGAAFWIIGKPRAHFVTNVKLDDRAFLVIDNLLDAGVIQDAINESATDLGLALVVKSAVSVLVAKKGRH